MTRPSPTVEQQLRRESPELHRLVYAIGVSPGVVRDFFYLVLKRDQMEEERARRYLEAQGGGP